MCLHQPTIVHCGLGKKSITDAFLFFLVFVDPECDSLQVAWSKWLQGHLFQVTQQILHKSTSVHSVTDAYESRAETEHT